ncbi:Sec-independent protein translocase TatB [Leifsonia shinshuensis]
MSFEKLLVLGVIAAFLIGPTRLPAYASKLALAVRKLRALADDAQRAVREEVGDAVDVDWRSFDPRQYDPRRIIRDALLADPVIAAPVLAEPVPAEPAPAEPAPVPLPAGPTEAAAALPAPRQESP